jgi:hypothetical protein
VTDTTSCAHADAVPVDVRDHTTGGTTTVAHICRTCLCRLPANWGCTDCEWQEIETRLLCQATHDRALCLIRPCPAHRENHT